MKKNCFLLILFLSLYSCSHDDLVLEKDLSVPSLRSADGKYKMLGLGYDVAGEYLAKESVRWPVLDLEKIAKESVIVTHSQTGGKNYFYYGYSSLDYVKETTRKTGFGATSSGLDLDKINLCGFSGNISYNEEFDTKYTYSTKFSFASADITKYVKSFEIADNIANLSKYVTAKFLKDLKESTPDQFVDNYGTHVLTDIEIGGHLKVIYRSAIVDESDYTRKKEIVKSGLNATLKAIGLSANVDNEVEIKETLTTQNKERTLYIEYKAGDGVGGVYDLEKESTVIDKYTWEKSVTEQNAGLTKINWKKTYPIYDFISDPVKKAQIKFAVERHIAKKQLEVMELAPIHRYWSSDLRDHMYLVNRDDAAHGKWYVYEGVEFYGYNKQVPGTVPLYRYWSASFRDHMYKIAKDNNSKYTYEGIECYVYQKQEPNTVPVYGYWSSSLKDHMYKISIDNNRKYANEGVQFYAYPGNIK